MDNKILLTIGRQYGSGGHEIGQRLSEKLIENSKTPD